MSSEKKNENKCETCEKHKMEADPCPGCPDNPNIEIKEEAAPFLDYAVYLFECLERLEMNLPIELKDLDSIYLLEIKNEKISFQNERVRQIEKQRKRGN